MNRHSSILLFFGLLLCFLLGGAGFLLHWQKAPSTPAVNPPSIAEVPPASPAPAAPPNPALPLTPAAMQDFEKAHLIYAPWPPKSNAPSATEDDSKKKSRDGVKTAAEVRLRPIWQLCGALLIGTTATPASTPDADASFDPDPGATLKSTPPPLFPPVSGEVPDYGSEPLPPGLTLPRANVNPRDKTPSHFDTPDYDQQDPDAPNDVPPFTKAMPDRWKIAAPQWTRYSDPRTETPYQSNPPGIWLPYENSMLKGDLPVLGQKVFLKVTVANDESFNGANIPTPSGITAANAGSYEFYGQGDEAQSQNNTIITFDLFQGETVFRPPDWQLIVQPVINWNYAKVSENGQLNANPLGEKSDEGNQNTIFNPLNPASALTFEQTQLVSDPGEGAGSAFLTRGREYASLEQASFEYHIADLSSNYDFVSVQAGLQPFNADFRGFVFDDTNLGYRLFGSADANRYQYNIALFDEREKDTNSQLNSLDSRAQRIIVVDLFKQDFFGFLDNPSINKGYTLEANFLANMDDGGKDDIYDKNGFLVRPEPIGGPLAPHAVHAYYFGLNGDGHIGPINLTNSFYEVVGRDDLNGIAGHAVSINAQEAAVEASYDVDWIRFKASFFYASGDKDPTGNTATGFDSIVDNPSFIGGPFSYYERNGFNLGGTAVALKQDDSLLPDLRTSKTEGQSNFVNPGVFIYGVGTELTLTPKLKMVMNANVVSFADTKPIEVALQTAGIHSLFGYDLSMGFFYRPLLTDNIVFSAGFGAFVPGQGYRDIYNTNTDPVPGYDDGGYAANSSPPFLYSAVAGLTFVY